MWAPAAAAAVLVAVVEPYAVACTVVAVPDATVAYSAAVAAASAAVSAAAAARAVTHWRVAVVADAGLAGLVVEVAQLASAAAVVVDSLCKASVQCTVCHWLVQLATRWPRSYLNGGN